MAYYKLPINYEIAIGKERSICWKSRWIAITENSMEYERLLSYYSFLFVAVEFAAAEFKGQWAYPYGPISSVLSLFIPATSDEKLNIHLRRMFLSRLMTRLLTKSARNTYSISVAITAYLACLTSYWSIWNSWNRVQIDIDRRWTCSLLHELLCTFDYGCQIRSFALMRRAFYCETVHAGLYF